VNFAVVVAYENSDFFVIQSVVVENFVVSVTYCVEMGMCEFDNWIYL
jgi:hypothetical protein